MKICSGNYQIEEFKPEEYHDFFQLIDDNREQLAVFFAGIVAKTGSLEETKIYCEQIKQRIVGKSYFPFVIRDVSSRKFVGFVDIKNIDWAIPKAEIGYCIDRRFAGKGITSEAVNFVIELVAEQHKFRKIFCRVSPQNDASVKVALKNKFELEGTLRREYRTLLGDIVDLNYYGRLFEH